MYIIIHILFNINIYIFFFKLKAIPKNSTYLTNTKNVVIYISLLSKIEKSK